MAKSKTRARSKAKTAAHTQVNTQAKPQQPKEETVFISEADQYVFAQGTHYDIYKKLGAHPSVENGEKGMFFGVWAPNAAAVHVIGSFNGWNE